MAKKNSSSAADDLIKSLLDDMNGDDSSSSEADEFSEFETVAPTASAQFPVGLDKNKVPDEKSEDTIPPFSKERPRKKFENVQENIQPSHASDEKTVPLKAVPSPLFKEPIYPESKPYETKGAGSSIMASLDTSLLQAENLRIAQTRILQLEEEVDRLRRDHEEVSSAADTVKNRSDEMVLRIQELEREQVDIRESNETELMILKGQLNFKDKELTTALYKIDDLEVRLKNDFRKIRVRERELENRLELVRAEKATLVRAKDDSILDLKRRVDQLQHEIDNYRDKCLELNKSLDSQKEQFKRTARALKMALTNLEVKDEDVIPLKKAE